MSTTELARTQQLYELAAGARIYDHRVRETRVRALALALREIHRQVDREDLEWDAALRPVRSYFFDLRHAPLPTFHRSVLRGDPGRALRTLHGQQPEGSSMYRITRNVLTALDRLAARPGSKTSNGTSADTSEGDGETEEHTLWSALLECLRTEVKCLPASPEPDYRVGVLLRERRHIEPVGAALRAEGLRGVVLDTERGMLRRAPMDCIVVVGPRHGFPGHLMRAPRAREIRFIRHSWIRDPDPPARRLPDLPGRAGETLPIEVVWHGPEADAAATGGPDIDVRDIEPILDWRTLLQTSSGSSDPSVSSEDLVTARPVLLEDRHFVLLQDESGARVRTLEVEHVDEVEVSLTPVRELAPGMFVLLRTRGASDYVASVADGILGRNATELRDAQKEWKRAVRRVIVERGERAVVRTLAAAGSETASRQNLRNWLSHATIHPQKQADFDALTSVAGLEARAEELWEQMKAIEIAHKKAGHAIRRELLKQVRDTDPDDIIRRGRVDFSLPGRQGGSLTAFRVLKVVSGTLDVPYWKLAEPTKIEE